MLTLRPSRVEIEEPPTHECFITGESWNGWECPYFTKEQADVLCETQTTTKYLPELDAYVTRCEEAEDYRWEVAVEDGETVYYEHQTRYTKAEADDLCAECPHNFRWLPDEGTYLSVEEDLWPAVEVEGTKYYGIGAGCWMWSLADYDDDPWAGDFSRGAWHALWALLGRLWDCPTVGQQHPTFHKVSAAHNHTEDVDELRAILTEALAVVDEHGISISEELWEHLCIVRDGGNPWAE